MSCLAANTTTTSRRHAPTLIVLKAARSLVPTIPSSSAPGLSQKHGVAGRAWSIGPMCVRAATAHGVQRAITSLRNPPTSDEHAAAPARMHLLGPSDQRGAGRASAVDSSGAGMTVTKMLQLGSAICRAASGANRWLCFVKGSHSHTSSKCFSSATPCVFAPLA
jgi:hypothetical protein